MCKVANSQNDDEHVKKLIEHLKSIPKSGLHNPFKNKERYLMLAEVNRKVVQSFQDPEVWKFFVRLIQRTCPKSTA